MCRLCSWLPFSRCELSESLHVLAILILYRMLLWVLQQMYQLLSSCERTLFFSTFSV